MAIPYAFRFDKQKLWGWRCLGVEYTEETISYPRPHKLCTVTVSLWLLQVTIEFDR